jgi:hypothetical protein
MTMKIEEAYDSLYSYRYLVKIRSDMQLTKTSLDIEFMSKNSNAYVTLNGMDIPEELADQFFNVCIAIVNKRIDAEKEKIGELGLTISDDHVWKA